MSASDTPRFVSGYRRLPLRRKLIVLISTVAGVVTLASILASFLVELGFFRTRLLEEYQGTAKILAANLSAAATFEDRYDSQEILSALSQREFVTEAAVYIEESKKLLAYYRRDSSSISPLPGIDAVTGLKGQALVVNEAIYEGDLVIGRVVLRADLGEMATFITGRSWVFIALSLLAILVSIILAARLGNYVARPINELAKTARRITEDHDFSTRQERFSDDETGQLVDAFNEMMAEIERRDTDLVEAKERAEASSKAKDDFLSVISHELRTPLNPIIGYVEILLRNSAEAEDRKQLGLVRQYAEHLQGLIDRVIDYSRFERGVVNLETGPVNFCRLCQNVVTLMQQEAERKGIEIFYQSGGNAGSGCTISTDRVKLQQVVLNLVANAVKFTRDGRIFIRSKLDRSDPQNGQLRIEVEDTGIGIAPEDREKVFRPFSQIDVSLTRQYSGMGLGLAITQKIVEAMGGEIDFESEKGKGSTFWIQLPVTFSTEPDPDPASVVEAPSRSEKKARVLLVDDQLVNLELGESMLESCGHEVVCAQSGSDAVKLASEQDFDLIILDIKMPRMNGYETAKEIRKREAQDQRTPIVALTAHVTTRGNEECMEAGMDDFMAKPFNTERLNLIVRKWLSSENGDAPPQSATQ